jgi:hypothetical protein
VARVQHIIPLEDDREHDISTWCWCGPESVEVKDDGTTLWVHQAADMREAYEKATGEAYKGRTWTRVEVEEDS